MLVLVTTSSPSKNMVISDTGMLYGLVCLSRSSQNRPWLNNSVSIIQLMLIVILHFVLVMDMVKVVWVL